MGYWDLRKDDRKLYSIDNDSLCPFSTPFTVELPRRYINRSSSASSVLKHNFTAPSWITNGYDGTCDEVRATAPVTLPRITSRLEPRGRRRRPSLCTFDSASTLKCTNSTTSPDRFVAARRPGLNSTLSYRTNKDPQILSKDEKLLRHQDASPDAFNPRRRVTSPITTTTVSSSRRVFSASRTGGGGASILAFQQDATSPSGERQVSLGTVWAVGGVAPHSVGVSDGRGGLLRSGTNAPLYTTTFCVARPRAKEDMDLHESRMAQALELDRVGRILEFRDIPARPNPLTRSQSQKHASGTEDNLEWDSMDFGWARSKNCGRAREPESPDRPFQIILDAPNLRDDFYCSVLAYCSIRHTLAVGLGSLLYAWSEKQGVHLLHAGVTNGPWLTTLGFSSPEGQKSILAFGRSDGTLNLMSLYDSVIPRFEYRLPCPVACLIWKPYTTSRASRCPSFMGISVRTEDLLVGDEFGTIYYFAVEWPEAWEVARTNWSGSLKLLLRISIHTQQICGLSFSCDGSMFATGGNDNLCCLFETISVLQASIDEQDNEADVIVGADGIRRIQHGGGRSAVAEIGLGAEKHFWTHGAAVKAIAFCPWRDGLVATGGGSNDKCIHFFHTRSGACLATINVTAQVTSLIWSTTRREIAATFGYAQPEHPFRIAVFSWPDCKQVAAIPWEGEHRALYAISYPGGPNESSTAREGGRGMTRTAAEGCIVVASSDESVKFHEVWTSVEKPLLEVRDCLEEVKFLRLWREWTRRVRLFVEVTLNFMEALLDTKWYWLYPHKLQLYQIVRNPLFH